MTIKSIRTGWTGISALAGNPVIGDFESIATASYPSSNPTEVDFINIPNIYQHLQIRLIARGSTAGTGVSSLLVRMNSDSGTNYSYHELSGDGGSASAYGIGTQAQIFNGLIANSGVNASPFSAVIIDILDYANTNKHKTIRSIGGYDSNGGGYIQLMSGRWGSADAINAIRLDVTNSFLQNSHFALYGIR
jgi:hypothetical protein